MNAWVAAARPPTLPAAIVPVVVGTACAHVVRGIAWGPALAALGGAIAIQIGTNFANDVFDALKGADGPDRLGPVRAVSSGRITAAAMKRAMVAAFAVASVFGLYLTAVAGWPVVAIGVGAIVTGVAYTGGPWPFGYHGLGDVCVLVCFGLVAVCGTTYVQVHDVPALALWASLPIGALATAILVVNNVRDRATDARAGKRTLAVRLGRRGAIVEYVALLGLAFVVPIGLAIAAGDAWRLLPLATIPLAWRLVRELIRATTGATYNRCLATTAQLLLVHGVLLAAGLAL